MDNTTGLIYLKKSLDTYDINVYSWLSRNHNIHIPDIKSFWEENGKLTVLEEYIQGATLKEHLSKGNLSESDKIRIVCDVCDALNYLHKAEIPIIHRDIKPTNIMLTNDGVVKLIDYDAAKVFHKGKNEDTTLIGTVGRAAPEQYGFAQSDARTDVYSMGLILQDMFPGDKRFSTIITKATAMNPSDRYQSIAAFKTAVEKTVSKSGKMRDRKPLVILTAVGALLLGIIIFLAGRQAVHERKTDSENDTLFPVQNEGKLDEADGVAIDITGLTIEESCWFISGSSLESYVNYTVVLENHDRNYGIEYPTVRITAKDKTGKILGTDTMTGSTIMPGDHIALTNILAISDHDSENDVEVEFAVASGSPVSDTGLPRSTDFTIDNITDNNDDFFPNVTGEITSSYKDSINVAITAILRKNGRLIAADTSYMDSLQPNTPTAFQIDLSSDMPDYDSVEVMVQDW